MLYQASGGIRHGRVIIGEGAVRKADVIAATRGRTVRPSISVSDRLLAEENARLRRDNESLKQTQLVHQQMMLVSMF